MERYYLNNMSDQDVTINLTANRTIKAYSSLPVNDKDIKMFNELKAKRFGYPSLLDNLKLSGIPIEQDSRYKEWTGKAAPKKEEKSKAELEAEAKAKAEAEAKAKEAEEKAKAEAEAKAKAEEEAKAAAEAEAKAKAEAEAQAKADEELKAKLRKEIEKQAKKEKRDFAEGDLEREVEEALLKAKEQQ